MARVFTETWEGANPGDDITDLGNSGYSVTKGVDATAKFGTTIAVNGTRCSEWVTGATSATCYGIEAFTLTGKRVFRRYVHRGVVGALFVLFTVRTATTTIAQVRVLADNTLQIRNGTTGVGTSAFVWQASETIRLEWWVENGVSQTLRIFHGANLHGTIPDETVGPGTLNTGSFDRLHMGIVTSVPNMSVFIDADADDDTTWPGPEPQANTGTLTATLPALTATLAGTSPTVLGVLAGTLPALTADLAANTTIPGYRSGYTGGYGSTGAASGVLTATLPALTAALSGAPVPGQPATTVAYRVYVDWDGDGGLDLGTFADSITPWMAGGTVPPTLALSSARAHHGATSMLITWGAGGSSPRGERLWSGLTAGVQYTLSGWAWVPAGSPAIKWAVDAIDVGLLPTATNDQWQEFTLTFVATAASHILQVVPNNPPLAGDQAWIDHLHILRVGEDVTARVLTRSPVTVGYGRDQARALAPGRPGTAAFELNNESRDYSPENTSSPLSGDLGPGREMLIENTLDNFARTVYRGFLDDFDVSPDLESRSVQVSCLDAMGALAEVTLSTPLLFSVRTGDAIRAVLDAAGWPDDKRDIDAGASVIRWWWEEGSDAAAAIDKLVASEGPPALATVGANGSFVFRDRHHRLLRPASLTAQATFGVGTAEPVMSPPMVYDAGWRDVVNSVTFAVEERDPAPVLAVVWESEATHAIAEGETLTVTAQASDPFVAAVVPVAGTDYSLRSGAVTMSLSRDSGQAITIYIKASVGPAVLTGLRLRAYPVPVTRTVQVHAEDTTSIETHRRRSYPGDVGWAATGDARAIAQIILARRAERAPTVSMRMLGVNSARLNEQLSRDLSDRVHIGPEPETGVNFDAHIEQVQHTFDTFLHQTTFGCEKAADIPANVFRFDTAGVGFGQGVFAQEGLDDPANMFRFDIAGRGFNQGLLVN